MRIREQFVESSLTIEDTHEQTCSVVIYFTSYYFLRSSTGYHSSPEACLPYPQYSGYSEEIKLMHDRKSTAWKYHRLTALMSRNEVRIQFFPQAEFLYSSVSSGCQSSKPRMSNPAASSRLT